MTIGREGDWHVHVHLVIDADYWPQVELADEWETVTGGESRIVDIREAKAGVERELLKYAFKVAGVAPARLVEYALGVKGSRRISTGGAWYGRVKDEDLENDAMEGVEFLTFEVLLLRAGGGDGWAIAVMSAVDAWIARRFRVSSCASPPG